MKRNCGEALEAGAEIIGVNNRNLKTFEVDIQTSHRLAKLIPDDRIFVVESGIRDRSRYRMRCLKLPEPMLS